MYDDRKHINIQLCSFIYLRSGVFKTGVPPKNSEKKTGIFFAYIPELFIFSLKFSSLVSVFLANFISLTEAVLFVNLM